MVDQKVFDRAKVLTFGHQFTIGVDHPVHGSQMLGNPIPSKQVGVDDDASSRSQDLGQGCCEALAVGSPGASRITTALSSVLINFMLHGMALHDAVAHPRVHAEVFEGEEMIAYEPGIPVESVDGMPVRRFPDLSMYFGGTQVAVTDTLAGLYAYADPRRAGGTARGG